MSSEQRFRDPMHDQPKVTIGIMDQEAEVVGSLNGNFIEDTAGPISGGFCVNAEMGKIIFKDQSHREILQKPILRFIAQKGSTFTLCQVKLGKHFHWETEEDQTFQGDLILKINKEGKITIINEIPVEDYLKSVISSEMNPSSPMEFLKAHTILSRSWLLSVFDRRQGSEKRPKENISKGEEIIRWYEREDHDLFDVCAGDHCQRYRGILKTSRKEVEKAVKETYGQVLTYEDEICDARFSKVCGGITEEFHTAWDDKKVPYLTSTSDAPTSYPRIRTEKEAVAWIFSSPKAYCNIKDEGLLKNILLDVDLETRDFFRWRVEYSRGELEEIIKEKSGIDFGRLLNILPIQRGPSGRISKLKILGSSKSMMVGKELEIRRWLSRSHLYSSAFIVTMEKDRFILNGAGWGHGVGLCQMGAAFMAHLGFSADEILKHYFRGIEIKKIY